jgi:hypothetical protein
MDEFCYCGRLLTDNRCPRHKEAIVKKEKSPLRKNKHWSGHSKHHEETGEWQGSAQ